MLYYSEILDDLFESIQELEEKETEYLEEEERKLKKEKEDEQELEELGAAMDHAKAKFLQAQKEYQLAVQDYYIKKSKMISKNNQYWTLVLK